MVRRNYITTCLQNIEWAIFILPSVSYVHDSLYFTVHRIVLQLNTQFHSSPWQFNLVSGEKMSVLTNVKESVLYVLVFRRMVHCKSCV